MCVVDTSFTIKGRLGNTLPELLLLANKEYASLQSKSGSKLKKRRVEDKESASATSTSAAISSLYLRACGVEIQGGCLADYGVHSESIDLVGLIQTTAAQAGAASANFFEGPLRVSVKCLLNYIYYIRIYIYIYMYILFI